MKPSVGRIVLYTNLGDRDGRYPPEAQAAIITKVVDCPKGAGLNVVGDGPDLDPADENRYRVSLRVLYEDGDFTMRGVPFAGDGVAPASEDARGKWAWPTRA